MAANEDTRHEVVEHGGLPVLLKFLHMRYNYDVQNLLPTVSENLLTQVKTYFQELFPIKEICISIIFCT